MSTLLEQASLVMIPSGYKEDVVYSQIPTNGNGDLSFTRASNGTRVNSAGLVEVCPWNLAQYSEDFSNAVWSKNNATITANATTAPNGTTTADLIDDSSSSFGDISQTISSLENNTYTFSAYIKAVSTATNVRLDLYTGVGEQFFAVFNSLTGAYVSGNGGVYTSTALSDGWFRLTLSATGSGNTTLRIYPSAASSSATGSVYAWGAQLNIGSTAKPYFPTTDRLNVPRLTYQNGGGGCPSLLLEKQSTNDFIQSENLFTTHLVQNLTTSGNVDVATSPDGTQNADKFVPNSTSGVHGIANGSSLAITSGQTYSFSAFVKSDGGAFNLISLTFDSTTAWGATKNCIFNASTGASYSVPSGATMSSQNIGNGWYRITATLTASGSVSASLYQYRIYIADSSGNLSYAASSGNTAGIYVWGAQLEASSYPTSYIPTTSASATRVADACFKTGMSSLIGQSEGTLFFDGYCNNDAEIISINRSTINSVFLYSASGNVRGYVYSDSTGLNLLSSISCFTRFKAAVAYKSNSIAFYVNGTLITQDTSTTFTPNVTMENFYIAQGGYVSGKEQVNCNQAILFPTRLTNAELASLTTI